MSDGNPLGIRVIADADGNEETYIPLRHISEEEVERLRAQNLEVNDGEQSGDAPPGNKDATAATEKLMAEALANPVTEVPNQPPSSALG